MPISREGLSVFAIFTALCITAAAGGAGYYYAAKSSPIAMTSLPQSPPTPLVVDPSPQPPSAPPQPVQKPTPSPPEPLTADRQRALEEIELWWMISHNAQALSAIETWWKLHQQRGTRGARHSYPKRQAPDPLSGTHSSALPVPPWARSSWPPPVPQPTQLWPAMVSPRPIGWAPSPPAFPQALGWPYQPVSPVVQAAAQEHSSKPTVIVHAQEQEKPRPLNDISNWPVNRRPNQE